LGTLTRVGLGIVLFAIVILFLMVNAQNLYAGSVTITPNPVTQGASFSVSGTGFPVGDSFGVFVKALISGSCVSSPLLSQRGVVVAGGTFGVTFSSTSLHVGTYCVSVHISPIFLAGFPLTVIPAQSIPEYPYGLLILAILMVIGYAVIKRKFSQ